MQNSEFNQHMLDVLSTFHEFCLEHDLRYFLIGGGLIGAVRHGGFIPWDDDIDVAMPRKDYERFLSLRDSVSEGFKVSLPFKGDGYTNTMTRMYSTQYRIQEQFIKRFTLGPWIDIFPIDNTFDNEFLRKIHFKIAYIFKILNACKLGGVAVNEGRKKARSKLFTYYLMKLVPGSFLSVPFEWLLTVKKKPGTYVANLMGRWQDREIIEREYLDESCLVPFENIKLSTFKNYDAWLVRVYGDYMKLPPVDERVPDHFFDTVSDTPHEQ